MKENLKKLSIGLMLLIAVVLLAGCSVGDSVDLSNLPEVKDLTEGNADYSRYTSTEGVSFAYPTEWVSVGTETEPMFMDPNGTGSSVNYLTESVSSALAFSTYVNSAIVNLKAEVDITGEIEKTEINLNGSQAFKLVYNMNEQGYDLFVTQIIIKVGDSVHMVTVGGLAESETELSEIYENIASSLKK